MCLWGFLCPFCLWNQTRLYDENEEPNESQLGHYPIWSCQGVWPTLLQCVLVGFCGIFLCGYGSFVGIPRHCPPRVYLKFNYSKQKYCCDHPIEDCMIGYFCCCCSLIQVAMANEEIFRMKSQIEGNVNIKRALI